VSTAGLSIAEFVAGVGQLYNPRRPETFWACEDLFRNLLASRSQIQTHLNEEIRRLIADPHHLGDWLPNEWVLYRTGGIVVSISLLESHRRFIHVLPFYALHGSLSAASLSYELYRLPKGFESAVFDPSVQLEHVGMRSAAGGEPIRIESDSYAYDFKPDQPIPVLRFVTNAVRPLEWLFSKETLRAWQANDAYLRFTQLRVAADVLGKLAHHTSLGPLKSLCDHPHHAVRWSAIQNLARVNRSEAIQRLERAANDPHPHVRSAALKTLERLQRKLREPV